MKKLKNNSNSILKFISFKRFPLIIVGLFILSFNYALAFDIGNYTNVTWSDASSCPSPLTNIDKASCKSLSTDLYKGKTLICCGFLKQASVTGTKDANPQDAYKTTMKKATYTSKYLPKSIDTTKGVGDFLSSIYAWGISIVGVLAFAQIIRGGILYMASGAVGSKDAAKTIITDALMGLGLALASALIIYTINPNLTNITDINLPKVDIIKKDVIKDLGIGKTPTESTTIGKTPTESTTIGETPTESTTKCMSFDELQGYVDADYNCSATGQECPISGQGSYNCQAPSTTPDCSIANYDSPKCASNTKTNFYAPTYTPGYTYKITGDSCPSDWIGKNFLSGDIPVGCTLIETSYDGEKYVPTFDATKTYTIGGNNCPSEYFGKAYVIRKNPTNSIPITCELYLAQ